MISRFLNRIGLRTWPRRIAALLIFMVVMGVASVELTSQSFFCNSCHIMNPYYDSWSRGTHKNVACVDCHISPGMTNFLAAKFNGLGQVVDDILNRTSMKPSASVSQLACTRSGCHDLGVVKAKEKKDGKFLFKHEKHLNLEFSGITLSCATCHAHVKGDQHFEVNTNVCLTCHLLKREEIAASPTPPSAVASPAQSRPAVIRLAVREVRHDPIAASSVNTSEAAPTAPPQNHGLVPPETCGTCHTAPAGVLERGGLRINHAEYLSYGAKCESCHRGTTEAPTPIDSGQCFQCHAFGLERATDPETMHRVHNEGQHKIECFSCHGTVHHGPSAQAARLDQFDCRKCHKDQHEIQRGTYLRKDPHADETALPSMSPMFLSHVDCTGCHIKPRPLTGRPESGATVAVAVPEACDACHKPGLGVKMIALWQKTAHSLYDQVSGELSLAESKATSDSTRRKLGEVRDALKAIRVDGSWGVHNPKYTQQLLEEARRTLAEIRSGPPAAPPAAPKDKDRTP